MVVLDTCALLWWLFEPEKLSYKASKACDGIVSRGALVSSIVFWEIGTKIKKGNLDIGMNLVELVKKIKSTNMVTIAPVTEETWIKSVELKWSHRDPVDRTVVAIAHDKKLPLVTSDKIIRKFYKKTIW